MPKSSGHSFPLSISTSRTAWFVGSGSFWRAKRSSTLMSASNATVMGAKVPKPSSESSRLRRSRSTWLGATRLAFSRSPVGLERSMRVRTSFGNGTSGNGLRVRSKTIRGPPVCCAGARPSNGSAVVQEASAIAAQQAMGKERFDMATGRGGILRLSSERKRRAELGGAGTGHRGAVRTEEGASGEEVTSLGADLEAEGLRELQPVCDGCVDLDAVVLPRGCAEDVARRRGDQRLVWV